MADLEKSAIVVRTELDKNLAPVIGNRVQLRQVMFNLVTMNSVAVRNRQLLIRSEPGTSGKVDVTVEDSGSGIDQKHIERIFGSFFTTKDAGMGMGLSICRSIIESHGGHLPASQGSPHGAIFRFTLPAARTKAETTTVSPKVVHNSPT
jgi:signal transduction histidine kinase